MHITECCHSDTSDHSMNIPGFGTFLGGDWHVKLSGKKLGATAKK